MAFSNELFFRWPISSGVNTVGVGTEMMVSPSKSKVTTFFSYRRTQHPTD